MYTGATERTLRYTELTKQRTQRNGQLKHKELRMVQGVNLSVCGQCAVHGFRGKHLVVGHFAMGGESKMGGSPV